MDFIGQRKAEQLILYMTIITCLIGFLVGYQQQDFDKMVD
jgi:Microsomal signal peptidase 12 kDa subunit (SPC12)